MSTETTTAPTTNTDPTRVVSDLELLHRFIGRKLETGQREQTVEECLCEFHRYLVSVNRLRAVSPRAKRFREFPNLRHHASREIFHRNVIHSGLALIPQHLTCCGMQTGFGVHLVNQSKPLASFHTAAGGLIGTATRALRDHSVSNHPAAPAIAFARDPSA